MWKDMNDLIEAIERLRIKTGGVVPLDNDYNWAINDVLEILRARQKRCPECISAEREAK